MKCGKNITFDETALHKKLICKTAEEFMCIGCCAQYFDVTEEMLREKIKYFKETGCTLFIRER